MIKKLNLREKFNNIVFGSEIKEISIQNIFYLLQENSWMNSIEKFKEEFIKNQKNNEINFEQLYFESEFIFKFLNNYQIKITKNNELIKRYDS